MSRPITAASHAENMVRLFSSMAGSDTLRTTTDDNLSDIFFTPLIRSGV